MKERAKKILDHLSEPLDEETKKQATTILTQQGALDKKVSTDWQVVISATAMLHTHKEEGMTGAEARDGVRDMVSDLLDALKRHPEDHIYVDAPVIRDGRP